MKIALREIHKHYGALRANDGITMDIREGTVHGILGENGAGKSTLMKILSGYVSSTSGETLINGKPVRFTGPSHATSMGIGMLYQDPLDFPSMTVLENYLTGLTGKISLGREHHSRSLLDSAKKFGFAFDLHAPVSALTVGERQQLEILRLLALGIEVLILDEPTTGISSGQKKLLFDALKSLARQGTSILLVSHKLEDVMALCDRATVLRLGKVTGELDSPFDAEVLLKWMFGSAPPPPSCRQSRYGRERAVLKDVSASGGRAGLEGCSVSLHEGEIVGLAGLEGSGQGVFLRVAAGLSPPRSGRLSLDGQDMTRQDYHAFQKRGVTFLPTARLEEGLIPGLTITEHFAIQGPKSLMVPWTLARDAAAGGISRYRIAGTPGSPVDALSGGNQQRLLLALMPADPRLLLLEQPTRGLDLESARWVWEQLTALASLGSCIVFTSSELEEIVEYAERVLVFFDGRIVLETRTCDTSLEALGTAVAGRTDTLTGGRAA